MAKVLPSDIARLVLAYLQDNDLKVTSQKFLEESPHLSEIRNNPECPVLPPQMKDLETLMEEHAVFIQEGKKRRQASPLVIQLWKKLDTVVAQLKYEYLEEKSDGLATISRKVKARQSLESLRLRQMQRKHGNCISNSSRDVPSTSQSTRPPHQSTCNSETSTTSIPVISPKRKSVTPRKKRSQEDHVPANQPPASDVPLNPEELMEFPQILESLLSDTTLPEKLAGAINKVLPPGVSSPRRLDLQNDSDLSSAIAAEQRQPVGKRAVDEAIEMTCSDPAFDSLFSLFNVDREKFLEDERRKALQDKNSDEMEKFRDSGRSYGEMSAAVARDLFPSSSTSGQDVIKSTDSGATGKRQENEEDQGSVEFNSTLSRQVGATPQEERKNQTANVERSRGQPVPKTLSPRKFQCEDESMDVDADREDIMDEVHSISDDTSQSPFPQLDDPVVRDGRGAGEREAEVVRHSSERAQRASALQNEDETRRSRAGTERGKDASQEPQSKKITGKDASSDSQRKENRESKDLHYKNGDKGKATSNLDPCVEMETGDRVVVGKGPKPESCAMASSKGKKGEGGKKTRRRDRYKDSQATRRSQRLEAKKQQTSASVNSPCSTIEDEDEQHHENPRTPSQMNTSERGLQAANEYAKRLLASMPGKESGGALDGLSPVALNITVRTASPNMECLPDPFEKGSLLSTTINSLTDCKTATSLTQTTSSVLSTRQNSEIATTKSKMSKGKVTVLSPSGRQVGDIQVESSRKNEENVSGGITSGNHGKRSGKSEHSQDDAVVDNGTNKLHTVSSESQTTAKSDGISSSSAEVTTMDVSDEIKRTLSTGNEVDNTHIVNIPLQYVQVATSLATNATNFVITPGQHQQALQKNRISMSQAMDVSSAIPHLTIVGGTLLDQNIPANSNLVVCSSSDPENSSKQIVVSDMSGDWGNDSQVIMLQAADSLLSLGVVTDTVTPLGSSDPMHQGPEQPLVTLQNLNNVSENSHRHTTEATLSSDVTQNVLPTSHVPHSVSGSVDQLSGNRCLPNSVNIAPEVLSSQNVVTATTAAVPKVSHNGGGNHLNLDQQGVSMLMNEELERSLQNASTQDIDFIFKAITMTPQKDLKRDGVRDAIKDNKKYSPLEKAIADKLKMFTGSECQTKMDEGKAKEKVSPWKNAALQSQSRSARNKKCVRKVFADEDVEARHPHSERSVRDESNPITRLGENDVESTCQNRPGSEERASNNSLKYSDRMPMPNDEKSLESKGGVNSMKYKNERSLQNKEDVVREQVLKDDKGKAVFRTVGKENEEMSKLSGKQHMKCNKKEADGIDVRLQKRRIKDIIDQEKQQKLERRMTTRLKESHLEQKSGRKAEGSHGIETSSRRHQHENSSIPSQHLRGMHSNHGDRLTSADQDARNGFEDKGRAVQGSSYARDSVGMDVKASREMKYSIKRGDENGKEISPGPGGRDFAGGTATSPDGVISDATVAELNHKRFTDSHKVDEKSVILGGRRKVSVTKRGYPAKRKDDSYESGTKRNLHSHRQQSIPDSHARLCQQTAEGNCTDKCGTYGQWDHSSIGSSSVVEVGHRLVSSNEPEGQSRDKDLSGIRGQREKDKFSDQTEIHRKEDKYLDKGGKETGHCKALGHHRSRSAVERAGPGNVSKARSNSQERIRVPSDGRDASCCDERRRFHSSENFSGSQGLNRDDSPPSGIDQTQVEIDFMRKDYENETSYNVNSISSYELAKSGGEYRPALRGDGCQLSAPWNKPKEDSREQSSLRGNWDESDREETHSVGALSSSPISVTSMSPRDSWKTESDYLRDSCSRTRGYISHGQNPGSHSSNTKVTTQSASDCINVHQLGEQSKISLWHTQNSKRKEDHGRGDGGGRSVNTPERHHREREQLPTQFNDFATLGTSRMPVSKEKNPSRKCHSAYDKKLHVERHARVLDENVAENRGSREESPEKGRSFGESNHSSRRRPCQRWEQSPHDADFLRTKAATRDSGRFSMEGPPSESKRHLETHRDPAKGDVLQYRGSNILDQDGRFSSVNRSLDSGRHSLDDQRLMEDVSDECEDAGNPSLHHAGDLRRKLPFDGAFRKPTASWMAENNEGQPCHSDFMRKNNSIDEEHRVVPSEQQQQQHRYLDSRREHSRLSSQVKRLEHSERHYSQDMDHRVIDSGERPREFVGSSGKSHFDSSFNYGEHGDASVKHSSREKFPTGVYDRQDSNHGHYNSRKKVSVFNQDRSGERTDRRHSHDGRLSVNSRVSLDQRHSKRPNEASRKHSSYEDSREIAENNSLRSDLRYSNKKELSSHRNLSRDQSFHQRTHVTKKANSMKLCDETQSNWEDITAKEKGPPSNSAGRENSDSQATSSRNSKRRLQEIDSTRPASSAKRKKSSKELSSFQVEQPPPACNSGDTLPSEFDLQKFLARLKYA